MLMELGEVSGSEIQTMVSTHTHPRGAVNIVTKSKDKSRQTYNGDFPAELGLDLALLDGVRRLILDYGEELFDTHIRNGTLMPLLSNILRVQVGRILCGVLNGDLGKGKEVAEECVSGFRF